MQLFIQFLTMLQKALAHGFLVQMGQLGVNLRPQMGLFLGVIDIWNFLAHAILPCNFGDIIAPGNILKILKLRMVLALVDLLQGLPDLVYILQILGKPRHSDEF